MSKPAYERDPILKIHGLRAMLFRPPQDECAFAAKEPYLQTHLPFRNVQLGGEYIYICRMKGKRKFSRSAKSGRICLWETVVKDMLQEMSGAITVRRVVTGEMWVSTESILRLHVLT